MLCLKSSLASQLSNESKLSYQTVVFFTSHCINSSTESRNSTLFVSISKKKINTFIGSLLFKNNFRKSVFFSVIESLKALHVPHKQHKSSQNYFNIFDCNGLFINGRYDGGVDNRVHHHWPVKIQLEITNSLQNYTISSVRS